MGAPTVIHMAEITRMRSPNSFMVVVDVNGVFYLQEYVINAFDATSIKYEAEYSNPNDAINALEERMK